MYAFVVHQKVYLYPNMSTVNTTPLCSTWSPPKFTDKSAWKETLNKWGRAKNEGLLESVVGEFDGVAPAGITYAVAGSSPGFFHQSAPHTSSAAAHTPEGKAVSTAGIQPGHPCSDDSRCRSALRSHGKKEPQENSILDEQLTHLYRYLCTKYIFTLCSAWTSGKYQGWRLCTSENIQCEVCLQRICLSKFGHQEGRKETSLEVGRYISFLWEHHSIPNGEYARW